MNKHPLDEMMDEQLRKIDQASKEILRNLRDASRDRTLSEPERRHAKEQLRKLGRITNTLQQQRKSFTEVVRRLEDQKIADQKRKEKRQQRYSRFEQRRNRGKQ